MSKLVWDKTTERRTEGGVDRGVLYLPDGSGVPWNGLTAVEEDNSDVTVTSYYVDGVKSNERRTPGDYSGTLKAMTYPDEFAEFDGWVEIEKHLLAGNQPVYNRFSLSYRTKIANDTQGFDHGYKIHLLYNLTATPDNVSYQTFTDQPNIADFGWKISGVPEYVMGMRPTSHVVIDTRRMNPFLVKDLEDLLYGKDEFRVVEGEGSGVDGGNPETSVGDLLDGGSPESSGAGTADGGSPYVTSGDIYDGGFPELSNNDILDGGSPSSPGAGVFDGGSPSSNVTDGKLEAIPNSPTSRLPPLQDLRDLIDKWAYIQIIDNGDGTWTAVSTDSLGMITQPDSTSFEINNADAIYTDESTFELTTTHSF